MESKKIIFLDFDGVLHPNGCEEYLYFCKLKYVEKTLKPFLGEWKIVISSNWKNLYNLETIKNFFSNDVKDYIIDTTFTFSIGATKRGKEIEKYILDNNVEKYIIIDDMLKFLLHKQKKFAIITDSEQGFTNKSRNKFLKIMKMLK